MPKRMRSVGHKAVLPIIKLNGHAHTRYFYAMYNMNDDLDTLLANRAHANVERRVMQRRVATDMTKMMDTGVRVNHTLAAAYSVSTGGGAASSASASSASASLSKPRVDAGLRPATLLVIGDALTPEECQERSVGLVDVKWEEDD